MGNRDDAAREAWATVRALNDIWTRSGNPAALDAFFHEDAVALAANRPARLCGRAECADAWRWFMQIATVRSWREIDPKVQVLADGRVAVVTYDYELAGEIDARPVLLRGRDQLVLSREEGRFQVVADHFAPMPGGP